jgi:hypothetical protein
LSRAAAQRVVSGSEAVPDSLAAISKWLTYDRFGHSIGLNTEEFVVVSENSGSLETRPKPHAGTPLDAVDSSQIEQRFRHFKPRDACFAIAVWDDSFDQFQKVKAAAVKAEFEYRLLVMPEGHTLVDRGGDDARVQ